MLGKTLASKLFGEYLTSRNYSRNTIDKYERDVERFYQCLYEMSGKKDTREVTREDIKKFHVHIHEFKDCNGEKYFSASTVSGTISVLSVFFRFLLRSGYILTSPFENYDFKTERRHTIRGSIEVEKMKKFLDSINIKRMAGLRDKAIFELMYGTGLRVSEVSKLDITDIDLASGRILVREGKGRKDRIVPIGKNLSKCLKLYLEAGRPRFFKYIKNPIYYTALFLSVGGKRIDINSINVQLKQYFRRIGIEENVCCHMIRHSFATHVLEGGAGIKQVQELLGHSSLDSTQVYTHFSVKSLRRVMKEFHPRENELYEEISEEERTQIANLFHGEESIFKFRRKIKTDKPE